jgi:hypothetical protein
MIGKRFEVQPRGTQEFSQQFPQQSPVNMALEPKGPARKSEPASDPYLGKNIG